MSHKKALVHFQAVDPVMAALLAAALKHPMPLERPGRAKLGTDYFEHIARIIIGQQLSTKAADSIWKRFVELAGKVTAAKVAKLSHEQLRSVGLSNAKASYIHSLATDVLAGKIELDHLDNLDDEAVIEELVKIRGVGRWSAEMFLMFTLGRPDVFSLGDLGLVTALREHYGELKPDKQELLIASWSPHRTLAALLLWHSRDNKPKL